jgi:hypothetical protein
VSIYLSVPRQESEHVFGCYEYSFASIYNFDILFWIVPTAWYFLVFPFIYISIAYISIAEEPSWSSSYGIWIYNYICNQCISESRPGEVYSIQHHVIKFVSDLRQVGVFFRALRFPQQIKLTATI